MKFVIYRRVSVREQGMSGLGLEGQMRDINLYLANHVEGAYEIVASFEEVDSGASNDRPALREALAICRKQKAVLLVAKLDRLSRRMAFIASLMEDRKVVFKVACFPQADNFTLHIYAALAEQERQFISERTKVALAAAKARGVKLGGTRDCLKGYSSVRKDQALGRAKSLEQIIIPLRKQGRTLRQIADALNEAGQRTERGADYSPAQVCRIISRLDLHRAQ